MAVLVILTMAVGLLSSTVTSTSRLAPSQRQSALAAEAARAVLETMRSQPFGQLYALYNADPADDPAGAGTAPGSHFSVPGLDPLDADADGMVGDIVLPSADGQLREDVENEALGLPRDLNGDGLINAIDQSTQYQILPVAVKLEWKSPTGKGSMVIYTMFVDA